MRYLADSSIQATQRAVTPFDIFHTLPQLDHSFIRTTSSQDSAKVLLSKAVNIVLFFYPVLTVRLPKEMCFLLNVFFKSHLFQYSC